MHVRRCDVVGSQLEACADLPDGGCGSIDLGLKLASFPGLVYGEVCCCTSGTCNGPEQPTTTPEATTTPAATVDMSAAVYCYNCIRNDTSDACAGGEAFVPNHTRVGHDLCASGMCSVSITCVWIGLQTLFSLAYK